MTAPLVDPSGKALYMWGPVGKTLTRIDIASGTFSSVTARIAATTADPVADLAHAIGRWMAPPVAAKIFVDPGLVLSPDGTRIFALAADPGNGETVSSQGVFVFDAVTLEQVAHWPPTADLTSIAISPDGAWLYAAGQPGFDAAGKATGDPSSITVYATSDGGVGLTAGRLGYEALSFTAPVLP
jgi:DNA-binding beta-propeller fold protein YncE